MSRSPRLRLLGLALLLAALPVRAADDASEAAFRAVRDEVTALRQDPAKQQYRHHYERLLRRLEQVTKTDPKGSHADDAVYVSGQLFEEMHAVSYKREDLDAAIASYTRVADQYPSSNLADDALYAAARLHVEKRQDPSAARALLERVVAMPGAPDFRPRAKELLALLPRAAPPSSKDAVTAALERMAADVVEPKPIPQVEVLPDAPPAGSEPRGVELLAHERTEKESVVRMRFSGKVGVARGEVPANDGMARRIFFDFKPARLPRNLSDVIEVNDGVMRKVRAGQYERDVVRLVIELEADEEPLLDLKGSPFEARLTVSLADVREERPAVAFVDAHPPAALPAEALPTATEVKQRLGSSGAPGGVPLAQQIGLRVKRIVIDPGHGGKDTGAIGKKGTREKDIALEIAKDVRERIQKKLPDVEVLMTREDDSFIALEERTRIANDAGADLFISIHCNANPSRKVRGVETYYLNITHDRYAIKLAARENSHAADEKRISDLQFILADLAMKSNVDESIGLGRQVQKSVVGRLRQDYAGVEDHGLKHALFYVLMGARMPAILVETSFISNGVEEDRLRSDKYRDAVADGIVTGVQRFVEERHALYAEQ